MAIVSKGTADLIDSCTVSETFVSAAFSSFPGAALSRSLLCCRARVHFGADRRDAALTRDLPIRDARILKALLQPPPSRE